MICASCWYLRVNKCFVLHQVNIRDVRSLPCIIFLLCNVHENQEISGVQHEILRCISHSYHDLWLLWISHQSRYDVYMKFISCILWTSYTLWCEGQGSSILSYVFLKLLLLLSCLILWTPCWLLLNLYQI